MPLDPGQTNANLDGWKQGDNVCDGAPELARTSLLFNQNQLDPEQLFDGRITTTVMIMI